MASTKKIFSSFLMIFLVCAICFSVSEIVRAEKKQYVMVENGVSRTIEIESIRLFINSLELTDLPIAPLIYQDYTLVPVREVFEHMGAFVDWNAETREAYIAKNDFIIVIQLDNAYANVNGDIQEMQIPAKIINDKTMIPLRFVSEALGFEVAWDGEMRAAFIDGSLTEDTQEDWPVEPEISREEAQELKEIEEVNAMGTVKDVSTKEIVAMTYPETMVTSVTLPSVEGGQVFQINTSSAISEVSTFVLPDNRLVVDVVNAEMGTSQTIYSVENHANCTQVRVGQFQDEPVKITRVVFDLSTGTEFEVSLSDDRRTISVYFQKNTISDIRFSTNGQSDLIQIIGKFEPNVNIFTLEEPARVVIDVLHAESDVLPNESLEGVYANAVRVAQFDENTVRIVLDVSGEFSHSVKRDGLGVTVEFTETQYQSIAYDRMRNVLTLKRDADKIISPTSIIEIDEYLQNKYTIELPGDYSALFGEGQVHIDDVNIKFIDIRTSDGKTRIVIYSQGIFAPLITADDENVYIKIASPKERYDKIVIIDPGHGLQDPGAIGFGIQEKDVNLDISLRLVALLEADPNLKVYATRLTDVYPTREERAIFANALGDLFVSVHNNSFPQNPAVSGTEVLYYPHANDDTIGISSKEAAEIMQKRLLANLGLNDRKAKQGDILVLRNTTIPAILTETAFISNQQDAEKLANPTFRQLTAEALYQGILDIFQVYTPKR